MDGNALPFSYDDLCVRLGTAQAPPLIDVRRRQAFEADHWLIIGTLRGLGQEVRWRRHRDNEHSR
jgi:hypothetical protein